MKPVSKCLSFLILFLLQGYSIFSQVKMVERWGVFEWSKRVAPIGNPFTDVRVHGIFTMGNKSDTVPGFYDGDGVFRIRYMPGTPGIWTFRTMSDMPALNGSSGRFNCISPSTGNHGMVKVDPPHRFKYADGKPCHPFGTTLYSWTHQGDSLEQITLQSLLRSPFNKVRMCIFPKRYDWCENEPVFYPYVRKPSPAGTFAWDYTRFDPAFFQHLEQRIKELKTVLFWLEQNGTALKATIQAMEVQKMTLLTLKGMNVSMQEMAQAFSIPTPEAAPKPAPFSAPAPAPAPEPTQPTRPSQAADPTDAPEASKASAQAAAGVVDPMQWWGALTQQFQTIANAAIKDAPSRTPEMPAMKASAEQAIDLFSQALKSSTEAWSGAVKPASRPAAGQRKAAPARRAPAKKAAPKSAAKAAPKASAKAVPKAAPKTKPAASPAAKRAR